MSKIKLKQRYFLMWLFFLTLTLLPGSVMALETGTAASRQTTPGQGAQIAIILPLSGSFAEYGKALRRGYELGFSAAQANAATAKYKVEYLDSEGDPEVARTLVNLIASEGDVVIASGTPLNATAWTASRAGEKNGLPYLIVGADQDNLINDKSFFSFRLTQTDSALWQMLSRYIEAQQPVIKTMGIIYDGSPCAIIQARRLRKLCLAKKIDLVFWKQWHKFSRERDNFYDLLSTIKENKPQILFLATSQKLANRLWLQGRRLDIIPDATISVQVNCIRTPPEPDHNPKPADQLIFATPWSTPGRTLSDDNQSSLPMNCADAQGAAAARVIIDVLQKSPNLTAGEIVKSMESTSLNTVYGRVKFSPKPADHQNQLPWYLSRNDAETGNTVVFPTGR